MVADAEESLAEEVEADLVTEKGRGDEEEASFVLRNAMMRMDALERMRDSLNQLKMLEESETNNMVRRIILFL